VLLTLVYPSTGRIMNVQVSGAPLPMRWLPHFNPSNPTRQPTLPRCEAGRSRSGGPVNAFTLWKPEAVQITAGAEHIGMFQKTLVSQRKFCKKLPRPQHYQPSSLGLIDVYAATLLTLDFKPGIHINYTETVLPVRDGLPKIKDFPKVFDCSGEQMA
jgi:hypothetical protein